MRTRRSLTTALALTLTLTATTLSAAVNREATPTRPSKGDRPSIITIVKRVLGEIIRAFPEPSTPVPSTNS